jgi:hypothetical protein
VDQQLGTSSLRGERRRAERRRADHPAFSIWDGLLADRGCITQLMAEAIEQ